MKENSEKEEQKEIIGLAIGSSIKKDKKKK